MRVDGRKNNQLRPLKIERGYIKYPEGSVLITTGSTVVLCNATVEEGVPSFLRGSGKGWITAEYSLLPRSTNTRNAREAARGKQSGRTQEIQRLIGRSLRSVVDLSLLGERQVVLDCDVLQADGGTRTASITGAFVALVDALAKVCVNKGGLFPVRDFLCAVSVGLVAEQALLDLCYEEDRGADVDMNIVMTGCGDFVELQGTGEEYHFSRGQLDKLLALGERGCKELVNRQKKALGKLAGKVGGTI